MVIGNPNMKDATVIASHHTPLLNAFEVQLCFVTQGTIQDYHHGTERHSP